MSIARSGTFDYSGVIPPGHGTSAIRLQTTRGPDDPSLVGDRPLLTFSDEPMPERVRVSPHTAIVSPRVLRSRLTLVAADDSPGTVRSIAFNIDRTVAGRLRAGDTLFVSRTSCGGVGLAIVRGGVLFAAMGAIACLPLGDNCDVYIPFESAEKARAAFFELDPHFEFFEYPVAIRTGAQSTVLYRGRRSLGDVLVCVEHGFIRGMPGDDECVAIWRVDEGPEVGVIASAQLLDIQDGLTMVLADGREISRRG